MAAETGPAGAEAKGLGAWLDAGWDFVERFRSERRLAGPVVLANVVGVLYGFVYYAPQFVRTPVWLWPWVPDSPFAVACFALALALHMRGRPNQFADWLAVIANIKVGLWTGYVLLAYQDHFRTFTDPLLNLNFWLFWLHLAMAFQVLAILRQVRFGWWSAAATAWFGLDIAMDYALAPVRYQAGCVGTKPFTVPCQDIDVLVPVTIALWLVGVAIAAHYAYWGPRRARAASGES